MCICMSINIYIHGVPRHYGKTAGGDFLGLYDKNVHINMCPILDGYGIMTFRY